MRKHLEKAVLFLFLLLLIVSCSTSSSFDIHSQLQEEFLTGPYEMATILATGNKESSKPEGKIIEWKGKGDEYKIEVSSSFGKNVYYSNENSLVLSNLYIGEDYFWSVYSSNNTLIEEGSFSTTLHAPRLIDCDGVTNFRDIGGWVTEDGSFVKQGLIYRSARFNENESSVMTITERGKETVKELGIRSEIDLRKTSDNENGGLAGSVLGDNVAYFSIPMKTGGNYLILNIEKLPALFEILADYSNYPLVYHCSIGTDRTGMVSFILNGLLGVGEEDLYKDYLFSNFAHIGAMRNKKAINNYIDYMDRYAGDTLSMRINAFLLDIGVDTSDISSFISIMKENKDEVQAQGAVL